MNISKWEYKYVVLSSPKYDVGTRQYELDKIGKAGWELVGIDDNVYVFKRPKIDIINS